MTQEVKRVQENIENIVIEEGFNPRRKISQESINRLAASMDAHGQLQAIGVVEGGPDDKGNRKFKLRYGERRLRAALHLGWKFVEVKILKGNTEQMRIKALVENIEREDMTALDEAEAISRYMEENNVSQAEMTKVINKSGPWISQRLKILHNGTDELRTAIDDGKVGSSMARELASLPADEQNKLLAEYLDSVDKGEKPTAEGIRTKIELKKRTQEEEPSSGDDDENDEDVTDVAADGSEKKKNKKKAKEEEDPKQKERLAAIKDFYEEDDIARISVRNKKEVLAMLAMLHDRKARAKSERTITDTKAQVVALEYMAGLRDSI